MPTAPEVILAVQAIVTRVAHTIDGKRWPELRALFADTVQTDYTSLFGGDVQVQRADDLMAAWQGLLPGGVGDPDDEAPGAPPDREPPAPRVRPACCRR